MENEMKHEGVTTEEGVQQKDNGKALKINKKTATIITVLALFAALGYVYKGLFVAAVVDGSPISRLAVVQGLEKASGKGFLDNLITEKLIENAERARNIVVSDDEINAEITTIEAQVAGRGGTLAEALMAQGLSMNDLKKQISLQKGLEKLVADKIAVTDEEAATYIRDNKVSIPKGEEATTTDKVKEFLKGQKLDAEVQALVTDLRAKAKIQYFVQY